MVHHPDVKFFVPLDYFHHLARWVLDQVGEARAPDVGQMAEGRDPAVLQRRVATLRKKAAGHGKEEEGEACN